MDFQVKFLQPTGTVAATVPVGTTVLAAARQAGILLESPCNGNGTCGKCRVKVAKVIRLACQASVESDLDVEILNRRDSHDVQILQHGHALAITVDNRMSKEYDAATDTTRIVADGEVLGVEVGNTASAHYGIVVDIGTTTLVTALYNLNSGEEIASTAELNPQSHHAQDVLSRIKLASTAEGLQLLHSDFIQALNRMIRVVVEQSEIDLHHIYEIVFSGNTCMLHLAINVNPVSMGKFPYTPAIYGDESYRADQYGIEIAPFAQIYLPPVMSAYVGADITSGVLAAQLEKLKGITLFVDIGTNGEMILAVDGRMVATSTAAGPAFEGMNIACGMRAAPGAIEKFRLDENGETEVTTIGDQPAIGICGSGLVDIIGELVKHGHIRPNGKLAESPFQVTEKVFVSQKDIRQVQLAKGAIRAGIETMLERTGVQAEAVDRVYIAGSFGYHLNPDSLIHIGLLPPTFRDKIEFLGNTSKTGGQAFLLNQSLRRKMAKLVETVEIIELATIGNFDKLFIHCLSF
ncbi:MAG TPA: ASKHA domain-containing protein [Negativicutes bacterium]|nr:ASKHA domain-containing protein [Negativicutes bacterium]